MIYLDYAATSDQKPKEVIREVTKALKGNTGNSGRGINSASLDASRIVYSCREEAARFFGFPTPSCIAFTSNSTEALNIAISGTIEKGDHIVTTAAEHNSVLRPIYFLKEHGVTVDIIPLDKTGCIRYDIMEQKVTKKTKAVIVTHASNITGNVTNLSKIASIIENKKESTKKALLIVDASQTAGSIPINASNIDKKGNKIDILCFTGHKGLLAPQGTGGICVMPGITIKPLLRGGTGIRSFEKEQPQAMPNHLEAGTLNIHGLAGLRAAFSFLEKTGIERIHTYEMDLMHLFYEETKDIKDITFYGNFEKSSPKQFRDRTAIIALNVRDIDAAHICEILSQDYNIAVRGGAHCAPLVHEHFNTTDQGMVRFSCGWFTTKDEIKKASKALHQIIEELT